MVKKYIMMVTLFLMLSFTLIACDGNEGNTNETQNNDETADIDEIVGIDPGSGTMDIAEDAVEGYDLDLELTASSEGAMLATLGDAIKNEEPIVVTLWQPHWAFEEYDLKYLDDPEGYLGEAEKIHTFVREGLEEEQNAAYQFLDNFYWEPEDMNEILIETKEDGVEAEDVAEDWVADNREKVDEWLDGIDPVENESIELAYVNWSSAAASTNVVKLALEELGYDVTLNMVDMGVAWQALSKEDVDGMLMAWLPAGSAHYFEEYKDEIVDLGPNLEGARQGFVVPEYMDIDSIEELPMK